MSVASRLSTLGLVLPQAAAPLANYVPFVRSGSLISVSGQLPMLDGALAYTGKVGADVDLETAQAAAKLCGVNIIAQLNRALDGDLERVTRIIKLGGFVNCVDGYGDQPKVINAASDLMFDVFAEKGRHSRSAVGVSGLPFNAAVEIDALVEVN